MAQETGISRTFPQLRSRRTHFWRRHGNSLAVSSVTSILVALLKYLLDDGAIDNLALHIFSSLVIGNCIGLALVLIVIRSVTAMRKCVFPLNWLMLTGGVSLSTFTGFWGGQTILYLLGLITREMYLSPSRKGVLIALFATMLMGTGLAMYEDVRTRLEATTLALRTKQLEAERARKLSLEMQLASLEARVHPHFLFNTLNSISALVRSDAEQAERMIERLSSLLRYSLEATQQHLLSLREELKIVRDYLEIQQARYGQRLRFCITTKPELESVEIPSFCLQTLVENSIKYAVDARMSGGEIQVRVLTASGSLRLEVRDDGPGFEESAIPAGRGLDNLQTRLAMLYGERAAVLIERDGNFTVVALLIPMESPVSIAEVRQ